MTDAMVTGTSSLFSTSRFLNVLEISWRSRWSSPTAARTTSALRLTSFRALSSDRPIASTKSCLIEREAVTRSHTTRNHVAGNGQREARARPRFHRRWFWRTGSPGRSGSRRSAVRRIGNPAGRPFLPIFRLYQEHISQQQIRGVPSVRPSSRMRLCHRCHSRNGRSLSSHSLNWGQLRISASWTISTVSRPTCRARCHHQPGIGQSANCRPQGVAEVVAGSRLTRILTLFAGPRDTNQGQQHALDVLAPFIRRKRLEKGPCLLGQRHLSRPPFLVARPTHHAPGLVGPKPLQGDLHQRQRVPATQYPFADLVREAGFEENTKASGRFDDRSFELSGGHRAEQRNVVTEGEWCLWPGGRSRREAGENRATSSRSSRPSHCSG